MGTQRGFQARIQAKRKHNVLLLRILWRRTWRSLFAYGVLFSAAIGAVYTLERDQPGTAFESLGDALWLGIVTLGTIGYGDVYPVTRGGRVVMGAFILFTLLTFGVFVTAISEAVAEVKEMEELGLVGTDMQDHIIVCGFGPLARTAIEELLGAGKRVAILCSTADEVAQAKALASLGEVYATAGDATPEVLRGRLNVAEAATVVIALTDDAKALIAAINARAVSPRVPLVAAVAHEELRQTLAACGVAYVAAPNELAGRLLASAAHEPEVARLVEELASSATGRCDVQQRPAGELGGRTVAELRRRLDDEDGPMLLGVARRGAGGYEVIPHPPRELQVTADDLLILLARRA